jgi:hypothetical protein
VLGEHFKNFVTNGSKVDGCNSGVVAAAAASVTSVGFADACKVFARLLATQADNGGSFFHGLPLVACKARL